MTLDRKILTLHEAASYLQITELEVMQWVVLGDLPGAVVHANIRFHRDHLDLFLKERAEKNRDAMKNPPVEIAASANTAIQHAAAVAKRQFHLVGRRICTLAARLVRRRFD